MNTSDRQAQVISAQVSAPKPPRAANRHALLFLIPAATFMVLILAASWAPDSRMTQLRWVPHWVAALADRDPNIRTAIPFIPLAMLLGSGLILSGLRHPLLWNTMLCLACVILAEFGQEFLAERTADVADVLWGGIGTLLGAGFLWLLRRCTAGRFGEQKARAEMRK